VISSRCSKRALRVSDSLKSGRLALRRLIFSVGASTSAVPLITFCPSWLVHTCNRRPCDGCAELLFAGNGDGQRVADPHRQREVQRLVDVHRARAGELGAQHVGDQRAAPHAVGDDLAQHRRMRVLRIDMRRVDVAGHDGVHLDVLLAQRAHQAALSPIFGDLVEGAVFDVFGIGSDRRCSVALNRYLRL
jgi:hypothetical protein